MLAGCGLLHGSVKSGPKLLRGGQREEGMRWLQSALRLDPNYAPAKKALADCQSQAKGEAQPGLP